MFGSFCTWYLQVGRQVVECVVEAGWRSAAVLMGGGQRAPQVPEPQVPRKAEVVRVSPRLRRLPEAIVRRASASQRLVRRARIILALAGALAPIEVARALGIVRKTVYKWRDRWLDRGAWLAEAKEAKDQRLGALLEQLLLDRARDGRPATFGPEQAVKLVALACAPPKTSGLPINRWDSKALAAELVKRGVVASISRATVSRPLREVKIKPHLSRYRLNACPKDEAEFDAQVRAGLCLVQTGRVVASARDPSGMHR